MNFKDIDPELQQKINDKPGKSFTIIVAVISSLIFPMLILFAKELFIDGPKERVQLTYDINQPTQYLPKEYVTDIEIENCGKKGTGESPVTFEVQFGGRIVHKNWRTALDKSNILSETDAIDQNKYCIQFKNFGPGAKVAIIFKTEGDLLKLPILKHDQIFFSPRIRNTLRKDLR